MTVLGTLAAPCFIYLTCYCAGDLLLSRLAIVLDRPGKLFLCFVTGALLLSMYTFGLCCMNLVYAATLFPPCLAVVVLWVVGLRRRGFRPASPPASPTAGASPLPLAWKVIGPAVYALFGLVYLSHALEPEHSADAMVYHVGLAARYWLTHGFSAVPKFIYSGISGGVEMIYVLAFAIGKHSALAATHLLFLLTLPLGAYSLGARFGRPLAGVFAGLLFFVTPVVGIDGSSAYNDIAVAAVIFASFYFLALYFLARGLESPSKPLLLLAGLTAGFGFACKYTAGSFFLFGMGTLIVRGFRPPRQLRTVAAHAVVYTCAYLAIAGPWLLRNAIQFKDPVFPFFTRIFQTPYFYTLTEVEFRRGVSQQDGFTWITAPLQVLWAGGLTGVIGPIFLLAPLGLLALRSKFGRLVCCAIPIVALTYPANIGTRFLIPVLPLVALSLGLAFSEIPRIGTTLAVLTLLLHADLAWPTHIRRWAPKDYWHLDKIDWRPALRLEPENQYLSSHYGEYDASLMIEALVPKGDKVLGLGFSGTAYHTRELVGTWESALGKRAWEIFLATQDQGGLSLRREWNFAPVTAPRVRLVANEPPGLDCRINEIRFYHAGKEVPRSPTWELRASANQVELPLAFDGSPFSWWTSGRTGEQGLSLQVDFGKPAVIDKVVVEQGADRRDVGLNLEIAGVSPAPKETQVQFTPEIPARFGAKCEFQRLGIKWIVAEDSAYHASDLAQRARDWGIVQAGKAGRYRLWHLL